MIANIFVLIFCSFMAWLLTHFRLRKTNSASEVRKLFPIFLLLVLFLLFNAFLSWQGGMALVSAADTPQITTAAELNTVKNGSPVILDGKVSDQNPIIYKNFVAYFDDEQFNSPSELVITLSDGTAVISNNDYQTRNWPFSDFYTHLARGTRVIVVGQLERWIAFAGPNKGKELISLHADMIFAGSHQDFVSRAKRKIFFPVVLLLLNLAAAVLMIILPVASLIRIARTRIPTDSTIQKQ
jgi:hypothetical protein